MATHCGAMKRVKASSEVLIRKLKADVRTIASEKIICAMKIDDFGSDTEAHQAAVGIYMIDQNLFAEVFDDVFKEIVNGDSFEQIIKLLKKFHEDGPIVYAYCSLFKYINRLSEDLWGFECVVAKLLKKTELDPMLLDKLNKLLAGIKKESEEYVKYQATVSYFTDFDI